MEKETLPTETHTAHVAGGISATTVEQRAAPLARTFAALRHRNYRRAGLSNDPSLREYAQTRREEQYSAA